MIIASITIYGCDICSTIHTCQSSRDQDSFDSSWYSGFVSHVCPGCCQTDKAARVIELDREMIANLKAVVADAARPEEQKNEYAH